VAGIFTDFDAWATALLIGFAMALAWEVGRWQGQRLRSARREVPESKFHGASLAVLGLLLGFTFSIAIVKHDQRRAMVVADANAIGDFYTCASLLNEPVRSQLQNVIREYATLRVELSQSGFDEAELQRALARMQQMQGAMTSLVGQALHQGTPIAVSLTNTLNGLTSNHAARLAAVRDRLPAIIVALLLLSAMIASLLVGHEQGAREESDLVGTACFIIMVTFAIYVILDLNQPGGGLIRVDQEPMQRLLISMTK